MRAFASAVSGIAKYGLPMSSFTCAVLDVSVTR